MKETYKVFMRSATNLQSFFAARKYVKETGLTYEEAIRCCERFNNNRTARQIKRGTKYEFTSEK